MKALCHDTTYIWVGDSGGTPFFFPNIISPTQGLTDPSVVKDGSLGAGNLYSMMTSGSVVNGDTITIQALPAGGTPPIWYMGSRYFNSNLTFSLAAGAAFGCATDEGNAILVSDVGGGQNNGTTITGAGATTAALGGSEIAWAHDTQSGLNRCINLASDNAWTIQNIYVHDCDFLVQALATNGTGTITNALFEHGGGGGPNSTSPTHNVYLSWGGGLGLTGAATVTNVRSYCTSGTTAGAGFMFKIRWPAGTFSNITFAEPSQHGYTDCVESAAMDISCGGVYTLGGAGAGQGAVFEVGPGLTLGSADGVIRFGNEAQGAACPPGGWATNTLLIQNCWIINDSTKTTITAVHHGLFASGTPTITIQNCKLVGDFNGTTLQDALGADVIDGGGNQLFATRVNAGLAAFPVLPVVP